MESRKADGERLSRTGRLGVQLGLWIAAALAIRLAHWSFVAVSPLSLVPTSDEFEHWELARYLAYTDWFGAGRGAYHRPQLFAYVLALLMRLTGGRIEWIHLAMMVFDSVAVGLLWLAGRMAFPRRVAFWGGVAAATYWPFVHFSATLYMESFALLLQAGMLLGVGVAIRGLARRRTRSPETAAGMPWKIPGPVLWSGALLGLLMLTRPQSAIAIPVLAGGLAVAAWRGSGSGIRAVVAPVLFVGMMALVLLPNAVRNYVVSDQWIWYSSNGSLNFYLSNNDRGISWETASPGMEWQLFVDRPAVEEGIGNDRAARMAYWRRKSIEYVERHPWHFLANLYDKLLLVWNGRIVHCTNNFEEMGRLSPVQGVLPGFRVWGTVGLAGLVLALVRLTRLRRESRPGASWHCYRDSVEAGPSPANRNGKTRRTGLGSEVARGGSGSVSQLEWVKRVFQAVLAGYVILYMAGVALFLAIERHRLLPVAPLCLFGGLCVSEWIGSVRGRRWGRVAAGALVAAVAGVFVNLPLRGEDLAHHERYWTQVNLGVACNGLAAETKDAGWLDKAREHFVAAYGVYPTRLEPLRQLAILAERREQHEDAWRWQSLLASSLARRYPSYGEAIGEETAHALVLSLQANRAREAVALGRQLAVLAPGNAQAHHLYGVALMAEGDRAGARREFEQTLRLEPKHYEARENLRTLDRITSPTPSAR